jgi:hypothetical protein
MQEVEIRSIYDVDSITQEKGWEKIYNALINVDVDTMIVFKNVRLKDPFKSNALKKLLKENDHIYVRFLNDEEALKNLRTSLIFMGLMDESRVENVNTRADQKTQIEMKIEENGNDMYDMFSINDNVATFDFSKKYQQLENSQSVTYCKHAINRLIEEKGIRQFIIVIGKLKTSDAVLSSLANMMYTYNKENIDVKIDLENDERCRMLNLYSFKLNNRIYNSKEKMKIAMRVLKDGTPGLLQRYKKTKAVDDFGRQGNGEVIRCRISVCRGFNIEAQEVMFDTFDNEKFMTRIQWIDMNDSEDIERLEPERVSIPIDDLGVCDEFLGARYHFMYPTQSDISENVQIRYSDENGITQKKECTIPERMRIVFDDREIEYDKVLLDTSIKEVKEKLGL